MWVSLIDLRHWFYQILISTTLQPLFAVRGPKPTLPVLAFRVLPMGWTWSPYIAQALAWAIILRLYPGQDPLGRMTPLEAMDGIPDRIELLTSR